MERIMKIYIYRFFFKVGIIRVKKNVLKIISYFD